MCAFVQSLYKNIIFTVTCVNNVILTVLPDLTARSLTVYDMRSCHTKSLVYVKPGEIGITSKYCGGGGACVVTRVFI